MVSALEQSVLIRFKYGQQNLAILHEVADILDSTVSTNKVGEYEGHEITPDLTEGIFYLYGPDAEKIFCSIRPAIEQIDFLKNAEIELRLVPLENRNRV